MEESHVVLVVQKYAPESLVNIVAEEETDEVEIEESQEPSRAESTISDFEEPVAQLEMPTKLESEQEVIRVPKIELSGLKVLGKIELPEPKKKDQTSDEQIIEPVTNEVQLVRQSPIPGSSKSKSPHHKRERTQRQSGKNPIELQREREAREAEERKRMALEREKEKRKRYYEEKVKAVAQTKRVKPVKEEPKIETKPAHQPTSWIGKFLSWWIRK